MGANNSKTQPPSTGCLCLGNAWPFRNQSHHKEPSAISTSGLSDCNSVCSAGSAVSGPRVVVEEREKSVLLSSPKEGPRRVLSLLEQQQYVVLVPAALRCNPRIWQELPLDICQALAGYLDTASLMAARLTCKNWSSRYAATCTSIVVRLPPRPRSLAQSGTRGLHHTASVGCHEGRQRPPAHSALGRHHHSLSLGAGENRCKAIRHPSPTRGHGHQHSSSLNAAELAAAAVAITPMPQLSSAFSSCSSLALDTSEFRNACGLVNLNERISAWAGSSIRRLMLLGPPPQMSINCLCHLAALSELELVNAGMIDARMLDNIGTCRGLTRLVVSGRFQAGLRFSLQPWQSLMGLAGLQHLHLGYGEASFITLSAGVIRLLCQHMPKLQTLDFAGCVDTSQEPICETLSSMPELSTLSLMHLPHLTKRTARSEPGSAGAAQPPDSNHTATRHNAMAASVPGEVLGWGAGWWDGKGDVDADTAEPAFPQPGTGILLQLMSSTGSFPEDLTTQPRLPLPVLRPRLKYLRLSNMEVQGDELPPQLARSLRHVELLDCTMRKQLRKWLTSWAAQCVGLEHLCLENGSALSS